MSREREKVVVAMSGGVDSSVAACLLIEQGYDVVGLFMRTGIKEPERAADGIRTRPVGSPRGDVNTKSDSTPCGDESSSRSVWNPSGASEANDDATTSGQPRGLKPAVREELPDRHRGCCSASDAADAQFVAGMLGIPFYVLNFEKDFNRLIDYFADEYANGRTPNPCIVCNDTMKFGRLVEYADAVGAKYVATGHYARIGHPGEPPVENRCHTGADNRCHIGSFLMRGVDEQKDQSYVLFGLERGILDRLMFPIGGLTKPEVREIAERFGLPNQDKPDSVEICFVPDDDYARVVKERRPEAFAAGNVVDQKGEVIGQHKGIGHYTVGQRRGLGIAAGEPIYVTQLNVETNTVTMGTPEALLHRTLTADRANFLVDTPEESFRASVKIRYLHRAAAATVTLLEENRVRVDFDEPQRAITPGQAVVFYDGDVLLGGAWIIGTDPTCTDSKLESPMVESTP